MTMQPCPRSLHFSSDIRIVRNEKMRRLEREINKQQYIGFPWTYKQRLTLADKGFTEDIYICSSGGITDQDKVNMFHLIPAKIEWDDQGRVIIPMKSMPGDETLVPIETAITEDFKKLKYPERARGFLMGGWINHERSLKMKNTLINIFEKLGIPYSILWGQRSDCGAEVRYSAKTDTWHVLFKKEDYKTNITTLDELKEGIEHIHISEGDRLLIGGKPI